MSSNRIGSWMSAASALFGNGEADEANANQAAVTQNPTPSSEDWLAPVFANMSAVKNPALTEDSTTATTQLSPSPVAATSSQQTDESTEVPFTVKMPASHDAREIRNEILREHFHYTEEDIRALDALGSNVFYVQDRAHPGSEAKREYVKQWGVDQNGNVTIPVNSKMVEQLQRFRAQRLVTSAVAGISDPALREQVASQLFNLLTKTGDERAAASTALSELAKNSGQSYQIIEATRAITNEAEGSQNAELHLALAKMTAQRNGSIYGPFTQEQIDAQYAPVKTELLNAIRLSEGLDVTTGQPRTGQTVDRLEAARINREAAAVYRAMGDEKSAREREMISRFYEADDRERSTAFQGVLIPRWKVDPQGTPMVRATTQEEQELRRFNELNPPPVSDPDTTYSQNTPRYYNYGVINKGSLQENLYREEQLDGSVKAPGAAAVTTYDDKGRPRTVWVPREIRDPANKNRVMPREMNSGVDTGSAVSAGIGILGQVEAWTPIIADLYYGTTAQRIAQREKLERAVGRATTFPVPPKPEDVTKFMAEMDRRLGLPGDPQARREAEALILEMSHAFWNR